MSQKLFDAAKEVRAILRSGSYGDGTWGPMSHQFRKLCFEILDEALNDQPSLEALERHVPDHASRRSRSQADTTSEQ